MRPKVHDYSLQLETPITEFKAYSQATKSNLLRPCLAKQSTTIFEDLDLWTIDTLSPYDAEFLMKFKMKWMFHGPPSLALHHATPFNDYDATLNIAIAEGNF